MTRSEIEQALERCELFRGLGAGDLREIARSARLEAYQSGACLFRQGDVGERLYVVAEGHVVLERALDLRERKGKALIGMFGPGRVLGCWSALLGDSHRLMSSAVCQKPTTVVTIQGEDLRRVMLGNRELGFSVLEKLCFLLRDRIQSAYGAMEKI